MHDTVIAHQLIGEANRHGTVNRITVEVGELATLTADELRATLSKLVTWTLEITERPSAVTCSCGYRGRARILERGHDVCLFACPDCKGTPHVDEGADIRLVEVEVDDA